MEFMTGVKKPDTLELQELYEESMVGKTVRVN